MNAKEINQEVEKIVKRELAYLHVANETNPLIANDTSPKMREYYRYLLQKYTDIYLALKDTVIQKHYGMYILANFTPEEISILSKKDLKACLDDYKFVLKLIKDVTKDQLKKKLEAEAEEQEEREE